MSGLVRAERRFRARRRAERRRAARPLLAAAIVTTVVGAGMWVALSSPLLRLDRVTVTGVNVDATSRLSVQEVVAAAQAPIGRSLLRVSPGTIRDRVAGLAPVASVRVRRLWPHTLAIAVVERVPVATVAGPGGVRLVDRTGVAFASAAAPPTPGLLDLRLGAPLPIGAPADAPGSADAKAALAVWSSLPTALRGQLRWVSATSPDAVSFALARGATVVWGSPAQSGDKLVTLVSLMRHRARTYDVSTPSIAVTSG